jgi:hypothetical protein
MRRSSFWTGWMLALLVVSAGAEEKANHEKLLGSWQLQGQATENRATEWIFALSGSDLQITQLNGEKVLARFVCATNGSTCKIKTGDDKGTISMWYNGTKLVQMETKGSAILKRRFEVLAPGDVMEVEFAPIVPDGKPEVFHFQRLPASAPIK